MASPTQDEMLKTAAQSLERIQNFDANTLPRDDVLGTSFTFKDVLGPATRLIELYRRLPLSILEDLPPVSLQQVRDAANADYNRFQEILKFDAYQANPNNVRASLINQVRDSYQQVFGVLHPLIAYSLHRTADFRRLETEGRVVLQRVQDESNELKKALEKQKEDAERILDEIRKVATEHGVTQQAHFFKDAADQYEKDAETWRERTTNLAWLLGVYAIASLFLHKIPWIEPTNTYQAVQLSVSKVLIFAVISYVLYLAARNFLSHKHNAIVNRHRQHALQTYKALIEGASDKSASDAVLLHAAACIYSPQPTGYTLSAGQESLSSKSVIELLTKPLPKA